VLYSIAIKRVSALKKALVPMKERVILQNRAAILSLDVFPGVF
jgi:hypothetical protein